MWKGNWWLNWGHLEVFPALSPFSAYTLFPFWFSPDDFILTLFLSFLPSTPFLSFTSASSSSSMNTFVSHTRAAAQGMLFHFYFPPPPFFFPLSAVYVFLLLVPFLNHFAVLVFAEPLSSELSLLLTIQHPLGWLSLGCVGSDWEWISSSVLRRELTIYLLSDDSSLSTSSSSDHLPNKTIYIPQICEQAEW